MFRKWVQALLFTMAVMGMFLGFLLTYFVIAEPETLTDYEIFMTVLASFFVIDILWRKGGESDA